MVSSTLSTLAVISFAASAFAQEPTPITTALFLPNILDGLQPMTGLGASVMTVNGPQTVLALGCAPDQQAACDQVRNGGLPTMTAVYAPTQVSWVKSTAMTPPAGGAPEPAGQDVSCVLTDTNSPVICNANLMQGAMSTNMAVTFTQPLQAVPVTITAGLELLGSQPTGAASNGTAPGGAAPTDAAGSAAAQPTTGAADRLLTGSLAGVAGAIAAAAFAL